MKKSSVLLVGISLITFCLWAPGPVSSPPADTAPGRSGSSRHRAQAAPRDSVEPAIAAWQTDSLIHDQGVAGASPGDTLEYIVTLLNTGGALGDASYNAQIDPHTTLLSGSLSIDPIAMPDAYQGIGNVYLDIPAASGLLANDIRYPGASLTITNPLLTSHRGASVEINSSTGAFRYYPVAGYEGLDTFSYTVSDQGGHSSSAHVSVSLSQRIWFVDSSAQSSGANGTLAKPFSTMGAFQAVNDGTGLHPDSFDLIFVHSGTYTEGVSLLRGQKLVGKAATASLLSISGFNAPSGQNVLPATGGAAPVLTTTVAGSSAVQVADSAWIRGLQIGNVAWAKIAGDSFGTLTISEVLLKGTGRALDLSNGRLAASFYSITVNSSGSEGIRLDNVGGSMSVIGGTTINNTGTYGMYLNLVDTLVFNFGNTSISNNLGSGIYSSGFSSKIQFGSLHITPIIGRKCIEISNATGSLQCTSGSLSANSAQAIKIAGVSSASRLKLQMTLGSVSANQNMVGISLVNTNGSFTITGTSSADGSGGTIQDISSRGIELINASGVSLSNMNLVKANYNGCDAVPAGVNYVGCGASVYLEGTNNISLTNVDIDGTTELKGQRGISGSGINGLAVSNCTIQRCGDGQEDGCVYLQDLSGTITFSGSTFSNASDAVMRLENNSANQTISISNCTFSDNLSSLVGSQGILLTNYGAASSALTVSNCTFNQIKADGLMVITNNGSSASVNVSGSSFDGAGFGSAVSLVSANTSTLNFNVVNNPSVKGQNTSLINVVSMNTSALQGRINNNTLTHIGGEGDTGNGVTAMQEDNSTLKVEINNNTISGIYEEYGILARSRYGSGRLDATITSNTITLPANASNGYGTGIGVAAGISGSTQYNVTCGHVKSNSVSGGIYGFEARSVNTHILYLQSTGSPTSAASVWGLNSNLPNNPSYVTQSGTWGVQIQTGTCLLPNNPSFTGEVAGLAEIPVLTASEALVPREPLEEESPPPVAAAKKTSTVPVPAPSARFSGETVVFEDLPLATDRPLTLRYRVLIDAPLPAGICEISNQGTVSGAGIDPVLTDDPASSQESDATQTTILSEPLIINCPGDIEASADSAWQSFAVQANACPAAEVTYRIDTTEIGFPYLFPVGTTQVRVIASNGVGSPDTCVFNVTIHSACPLFQLNAGSIASCFNSAEAAEAAAITATEVLGTELGPISITALASGSCQASVLVTATDTCGNMRQLNYKTRIDSTAPQLDYASEIVLAADTACQAILPDFRDSVSLTDNCPAGIVLLQSPAPGTSIGVSQEATVYISATDLCGRTATLSFGVSVTEHVAPVITYPAQSLVSYCTASAATALDNFLRTHGNAQATDACSGQVIAWTHNYVENLSDDCSNTGTVLVTFTATDQSGNTAQTSASFTILDNAAPTVTAPAAITLACGTAPDPSNSGTATASDVCGSINPESQGIWINELHYAMAGADNNEFIEIAGPAGLNLSGSALYLYRYTDGKLYHTKALSGVIPNQGNGRGTLVFSYPANTIADGRGGICLAKSGVIQEFIAYGRSFAATNGLASGMAAVKLPLAESDAGSPASSLQRIGTGRMSNTFRWSGPAASSPGLLNSGQSIGPVPQAAPAPQVSYVDNIVYNGQCGISIQRKWRAKDACGNTSPQVTQMITISPAPAATPELEAQYQETRTESRLQAEGYALFQNAPNPWSTGTVIRFSLPESAELRLSVLDMSGKCLYSKSGTFDKGLHEWPLSAEQIPASGICYYRVETTKWTAVKKMILVK